MGRRQRYEEHRAVLGIVAIGILALTSVAGLAVAEARFDDLDQNGSEPVTNRTSADAPTTTAPGGAAAELLAAMNRDRERLGAEPLSWDPRLARVAKRWADHMAEAGRLAHQDLEPILRLGFASAAENIASAPPGTDATTIAAAWMDSPPNRSTVVDPAFTVAGIGLATGDDGQLWIAVTVAG